MDVLHKLNEDRWIFWCPGCQGHHFIQVNGNPKWDWNDDLVKPTVSPSILVRGTRPTSDLDVKRILAGEKVEEVDFVCHIFVKNGQIQYLSDCTRVSR